MITLTEKAAEKVKSMMSQQGLADHALRLRIFGGGCAGFSYDLDIEETPQAGDQTFDSHGVKVLVDGKFVPYVDGTEIDYEETPLQSGFRLNNPQATHTCSCGSSFQV